MSKITISAVLTCLRLVIGFVSKVIRLIYTIIDLVDDGCINASVARPDWMDVLVRAIDSLENLGTSLSDVEDTIYHESQNNG